MLPEDTIVVDESNTGSMFLPAATAGSPRHDLLTLTGGAIGYGLPAALGAAVAAPDRPVLCLEADGSAMYTLSALWTHARENLDNNHRHLQQRRLRHPADGTPARRRSRRYARAREPKPCWI